MDRVMRTHTHWMDRVMHTHTDRLDGQGNSLAFSLTHSLFHIPLSVSLVMYSNTEQSSVYLTQSSPVSLTQSIHYSSKTIYLCWHYLTDAVR